MIHLHKIMTGTTPLHKSNYNTCHLLGTRLCNDGLTTNVWSSIYCSSGHVTSSTGDSNNNHDYEYNYCNTPYGASNSPTDKTVI